MPTDPHDGHEVHLREHPVPGGGRMYQVRLSDGTTVGVITQPGSTDRQLTITPPGVDESVASVALAGPEATTVSALLSGVRFTIDRADADQQELAGVNTRTVTLSGGSPAVGRTLHDLEVPDHDHARVIAVIRDDTPELIEGDVDRPCQAGDRLLLVGRPDALQRLGLYLQG